ncbi:MAG TPA: hypothetical protein VIL09_07525 [Microvirga sp.]|jgi:hypothetical protein
MMRRVRAALSRWNRAELLDEKASCPLFDAVWYAQTYPEGRDDPWAHYRAGSLTTGRRPNPYFAPAWYLAHYPDVAALRIDPLEHYWTHGFREGRDPGPAFSTAWYRDMAPVGGANPLEHYIAAGRGNGLPPHPRLAALDLSRPLVGIVILPGSRAAIERSLAGLAGGSGTSAISVLVLDDGRHDGAAWDSATVLPVQPSNARLADAVSEAVAAVLRTSASHVLLLTAGAVLSKGAIDRLLDTCEPVVAPVTVGAGTAQALPTGSVAGHAARPHVLRPVPVAAGEIEFCGALIRREAFAAAGGFQDLSHGLADPAFCRRLKDAGFSPTIARHVIMEQSSDPKAGPPSASIRIESLLQDVESLSGGADAASLALVLASHAPGLRKEAERLHERERQTRLLVERLAGAERSAFEEKLGSGKPFVVLSGFDPVTGDERDGYVQRVKAVDAALDPSTRVYVTVREEAAGAPEMRQLGERIWSYHVAADDLAAEPGLRALMQMSCGVYAHSIFTLQAPSVLTSLAGRGGPLILDLHGAVPEEYAMRGSQRSAALFEAVEARAIALSDRLVCVSEAMAQHYAAKHDVSRAAQIVCPIVSVGEAVDPYGRPYHDRPRAIYAGGTQPWQQVPKIVAAIAATQDEVDAILMTPDVDGFARALAERGLAPDGDRLTLRSASHQEVLAACATADFGFLLRQDTVVNRVACPTKLIEYLAAGVIPVLDSPAVGDFVELGMAYVPLDDFIRNDLPSPVRRREMARTNLTVCRRLQAQSAEALQSLKRVLVAD